LINKKILELMLETCAQELYPCISDFKQWITDTWANILQSIEDDGQNRIWLHASEMAKYYHFEHMLYNNQPAVFKAI